MEKELNMEREKLKEQEKIINIWEICDCLAQGMLFPDSDTFANGRSF